MRLLIHRDGVAYTGQVLSELMVQVYKISITDDNRVEYTSKYCKPHYTCQYSDQWPTIDLIRDASKYMLKTAELNGWTLYKKY